MIGVAENPDKPLPVVLKPVLDELLSSWLGRHAAYYGVTGPFLANWLILGTSKLSALDYRLSLPQVARLSEKLRCDPISLLRMTFADTLGRYSDIICRGRVPQICRPCADRFAQENAADAVLKHWREAWRITCPVCRSPLCDTDDHYDNRESLRDTSPFGFLWSEALAGEEIIERFLGGDDAFEYSPIALMRLLLVGHQRHDVLIENFRLLVCQFLEATKRSVHFSLGIQRNAQLFQTLFEGVTA